MRWVWLALAVWGAIHPMYFFISWLAANGWSIGGMIDAWGANASTIGLTWDLIISAIALTIWVLVETARARDWPRLLAIPATFCIGVSCGLPLYLYLRSRTA